MSEKQFKITIPGMPLYSNIKYIVKIWNNLRKEDINNTIKTIFGQLGTVETPVDWSDPDKWIKERLTGEEANIASRIWNESDNAINPRYVYGLYNFVNTHKLLIVNDNGIFHINKRGQDFLNNNPQIIQEIDNKEGIIDLLNILSVKKSVKTRDLLPDWDEFLREFFKYGKAQTHQEMLRSRLNNLIERRYVSKERGKYSITVSGLEYINSILPKSGIKGDDLKYSLSHSIDDYNEKQKKILREKISKIDPIQFEHLVKNLLEEMGYENVFVTKQSGDQGVDVVGTVQIGISTITEVVQVKRHKSNINRPIIDQLRGALPYHKALRGTIITTGNFSKGCDEAAFFPGAAPITLIDGDGLIDHLIKYQIGIIRRPVDICEVDDLYFSKAKQKKLNND